MMIIIDASVAIKWFVAQESGKDQALEILHSAKNKPQEFAVPELFFNEMLAVFCRLEKDLRLICEYLESLQDFGFVRLGNGRRTLSLAAELGTKYHLSGYDAIYAANAKLVGGLWITADERAHKKIASLKISIPLSSL